MGGPDRVPSTSRARDTTFVLHRTGGDTYVINVDHPGAVPRQRANRTLVVPRWWAETNPAAKKHAQRRFAPRGHAPRCWAHLGGLGCLHPSSGGFNPQTGFFGLTCCLSPSRLANRIETSSLQVT